MNETINPLVDQSNGKFKWPGDFDLFKKFVEDILKIIGKWTSPRGSCKQIKTANITLRLYENGSVLLEGPMVDEYRKILEQVAMISSQKELNMGESIKIKEETIGASSLRDVARRLDSLTDQFKKHKTESGIVLDDVITTLEAFKNSNSTDYIALENTSLK